MTRLDLPAVVDPPDTLCLQLAVPNDPAYISAVFGAILLLSSGWQWKDDPAHTAQAAAARMRRMYLDTIFPDCACPTFIACCGGDDMGCPQLQFNCGVLQIFDCITQTWVNVPSTGSCAENPAPGAGAPQPGPGQSSGNQCLKAEANSATPLPWLVSTGDTLDFTSVLGAGNDGASIDYYCPDGSYFIAGACAGGGGTSGSDPLPTTKHMALLLLINGSYYPLTGGIFTVPGGVSNKQVFIQVNDPTIANCRGEYSICVTYANNAVGTWRAHIDFTRSSGGLVNDPFFSPGQGVWTPGSGWVGSVGVGPGPVYSHGVYLDLVFASAANILGISVKGSKTDGSSINPSNVCFECQDQASNNLIASQTFGSMPSSPFNMTGSGHSGVTKILLLLWDYEFGSPGGYGSTLVTDLYLNGSGTIPPELAAYSY